MEDKKRVTILVVIALILAITAIVLNVMDDSRDISTSGPAGEEAGGGEIGVVIEPAPVEDKLAGEIPQ